jgi:hypothetical protein
MEENCPYNDLSLNLANSAFLYSYNYIGFAFLEGEGGSVGALNDSWSEIVSCSLYHIILTCHMFE